MFKAVKDASKRSFIKFLESHYYVPFPRKIKVWICWTIYLELIFGTPKVHDSTCRLSNEEWRQTVKMDVTTCDASCQLPTRNKNKNWQSYCVDKFLKIYRNKTRYNSGENGQCCWLSNAVHCVKSVRIRSFSGPYFTTFGLNRER